MFQVCDTILVHAEERFAFTQLLVSATLLHGELFPQHSVSFPEAAEAVEAYPMLDKAKLKTELSLIYENSEFKACASAPVLHGEQSSLHFLRECQSSQEPHDDTHDNGSI